MADGAALRRALRRLERDLAQIVKRRARRRLTAYRPYAPQAAFHAAGAQAPERLFMAANQVGKTFAGACEVAIHATGAYPDWWRGRRFERPNRWWVGGVTAEATRDNPQRLLVGAAHLADQGVLSDSVILRRVAARQVPGALDGLAIRHVSGGVSWIGFKAYAQGREKWQGETLDGVWFDEEPPEAIYAEGLTRTNATGGLAFLTFTPLLGVSAVVLRFLGAPTPGRAVIRMRLDEAGHFSAADAARIATRYSPQERAARARGEPALGSGRVFPLGEEAIVCAAFAPPAHWAWIGGLDFGWDHPTAAVRLAWDRDEDVVYVVDAYRARERTPAEHAAALRGWGGLAYAWPQDGLQHDKGSGQPLADQFRRAGLRTLPAPACFPGGGVGVEAGVMEMLERMRAGRLRVFAGLDAWFEEFRLYHRKEGRIVKRHDDLLCATRYALMALRYAAPLARPPRPAFAADDHDYGGR